MKRDNLIYWTTTGIFGAFMMFSAIPDILVVQEAADFITKLGYPLYLVPFLGYAKALGVIALFVPGFPRVREWAYAGLFFDLVGAFYSGICTEGFQPQMLGMAIPFAFLFVSHAYWHKRMKATASA